MKLFNYFRSSASWRVRIGLALKGLDYDYASIHLQKNEQFAGDFAAQQASHLVPALVLDDGRWLSQSMAILEYLEEAHPEPPLLPRDVVARAQVRALAQDIGCDIHPINNLRVLQYLRRELGVSEEQKTAWYRHWITLGLGAVEAILAKDPRTGRFCHGDTPTLADCCLLPQVFNARRFDCDLTAMPTVRRIAETCEALDALHRAAPAGQPDAD